MKSDVGEYALSAIGPGRRALSHWKLAGKYGLRTMAKVQVNNTWELSSVPFIPVPANVAEHMKRLRTQGLSGLMLSWSLGGYPSINLKVVDQYCGTEIPSIDAALRAVAAESYGAASVDQVVQAWRRFSKAFDAFPFHIGVIYQGPQQMGPANPLYLAKTHYHATMTGIPYDHLDGWRAIYPRAVFEKQFRTLANQWAGGVALFQEAIGRVPEALKAEAQRDLGVAKAVGLHFASVANQAAFVRFRDQWLDTTDAGKKEEIRAAMLGLCKEEALVAGALYRIAIQDARIGFEAANQYFYLPRDLLEKMVNCRWLSQELGKSQTMKLPAGKTIRTPLVLKESHTVIDGNGATLVGPGIPGKPETFQGIGILAEGVSHITIKNLKVKGFACGLKADNGTDWRIEHCDFSDNYHDPDYGWGDYKRVGGMILTDMADCVIKDCKANRVWNGLDLWGCRNMVISGNDFSHCSNVCLKMWRSCGNTVRDNDLSYGLRIRPGEVHARDSTCVLMESGSDNNRFEKNNITHGGDGVFIRVLNGWVSTGNVFVENDCSHANNNGFEAWSPGNTYVRNKANHCSYGFWLGGSDNTVLIGNEAAYNGLPDGFHNAPESDFGHGGIVIVHGSGTHSLIQDNWCHHNQGGGIVVRGDLGSQGRKWRMQHLVIQNNRLAHNKWGLFARFTDWVDLSDNCFEGNQKDVFFEDVNHVFQRTADPLGKAPPVASLTGPGRVEAGVAATFDASGSSDPAGRPLHFQWFVNDVPYKTGKIRHTFNRCGFHRVGVTVNNGHSAHLAFKDVYVYRPVDEIGTEGDAGRWRWRMGNDPRGQGRAAIQKDDDAMTGAFSTRFSVTRYAGADVTFQLACADKAPWHLTDKKALAFWLKFQNSNNGGFQGPNPIVRLHAGDACYTYLPALAGRPRNLLNDLPHPETRYGWLYVTVPLAGGEDWLRTEGHAGAQPPHVDGNLRFDTIQTPMKAQQGSSMVSAGDKMYCAIADGNQLYRSVDGRSWTRCQGLAHLAKGGGCVWQNGMLAYHSGLDGRELLFLRHWAPERDAQGRRRFQLAEYHVAEDAWRWYPAHVTMGHGAVVVGDALYGLAHAVGGNYGGPLCRLHLTGPVSRDERSVLKGIQGENAHWLSRAAQLACLDGRIYGIKNDWKTPQPKSAGQMGDRLFSFDPKDYRPSRLSGGNVWSEAQWRQAETPAVDLGPLPFEVGHGAALVALPPNWSSAVGDRGGLFVLAGCSPSNHEGFGPPADLYAIYDVAGRRFTLGRLPNATGTGSSAALHGNRLFIKRGGLHYEAYNDDLWMVTPVPAADAESLKGRAARAGMDLRHVSSLSIQFDSGGHGPFTVWLDELGWQ